MNPLDLYLVRRAHEEFDEDGCLSLDTAVTLLECGIDAEALEDAFACGLNPYEIPDTPVILLCTQEDVEDFLDTAIGNNIERMIDIKTACDNLLEKE